MALDGTRALHNATNKLQYCVIRKARLDVAARRRTLRVRQCRVLVRQQAANCDYVRMVRVNEAAVRRTLRVR